MASKPATPAKQLSTNTVVAIAAVVSVLVLLVCGYLGLMLGAKLITNSKVVLAQTKALGQLDTKQKNAQSLVDSYHSLGTQSDLIAHSLPAEADFPALISIMENAAAASGVSLSSVTPLNVSATAAPTATAAAAAAAASTSAPAVAGATPYSLNVEVSGSYARVIGFLKNLELSSRPMRPTNIQVSGTDSQLSVTLTLTTYYKSRADIGDQTEAIK